MKIILFANTPWYLYNYCLPLAKSIQQAGDELLLLCPHGEYAANLEEVGFTPRYLSLDRRGSNPIRELASIRRIRRIYQQEKPDLVHHFTTKCVIYGSLAARAAGVPRVVNSITGLGYAFSGDQPSRRGLQVLIRILYRRSLAGTTVLFQNPDDRRDFIQHRLVAEENTVLIRSSGVDLERFTVEPEPEGIPSVLFAARMLVEKGAQEFVQAARLLRSRQVPARFIMVGKPDPQSPASISEETLRAWHAEGVIEWWGWQMDMAPIYRQVHLVCMPSYYREGIPKTLIEAAASGRAIVTTDTRGCREVVQHGHNGLLVAPRSAVQLADAIQTLLTDRTMRLQMGTEGRRVAEQNFKLQDVLKAILAIYRSG